ncbi:TonB-dependent receptor [Paucibacter sp. M5-1]|uniref:TonB-dependent receptor n=1 Tax=Paucibacter sp. M5-1 TaxID=3015998 RepID=UPI0022B8986B|nr:TonB-dependent receptor [Paucibacter sp. M5-1]MCZ7882349.1 TonB-dependent receptor [Paucibacter sp. M5-1]
MTFKPTQIAQAVALSLLLGSPLIAAAQTPDSTETTEQRKAREAAEEKLKAQQLGTVTITGIRASVEQAINIKRMASSNVEVITAVDVGKMPDKNLADSLQRLVGVAVRSDYDEAEKVSMRGTNADMSLILFNGHTVSGGDWYVADQLSSSRSTSLSLMPSSVLNQATVYKTSQANIVDGGLAGTIDVTTRKPLDEKSRFGGVASAGAVYADLPGKTSPQLNASFNWKNEANNFGVIGQVFKEKRHIRRDTASRFAYGTSSGWGEINTATMKGITDASLAGTGYKAADLNGVRLPGSMSSEFVEGVRDRSGGMLALQARPTQNLDIGLTGFYSSMKANNFGRLNSGAMYSMLLGKADSVGATGAAAANTNSNGQQVFAQIRNPVIVEQTTMYGHKLRVLKSADIVFADGTSPQYIGNSEAFYRDGATASSGFLDLDAKWQLSKDLVVKGLFSTTRGVGETQLDQGLTYARYGTGVSYALGKVDEAPFVQYHGAGANLPVLNADGSGYKLVGRAASSTKTVDSEQSLAIDAEYTQDSGVFTSLAFGARHAEHKRDLRRWAPTFRSAALAGPDPSLAIGYPGNFGQELGGGNWDRSGFYFPKDVLTGFMASQFKATTPEFERRVASEIEMREKQSALYLMQNLEGPNNRWSGNVGLRLVRTTVDAQIVTPLPAGTCAKIEPGKPATPCAAFPGAINTAGDGSTFFDGAAFNPAQGTVYYKVPSHKQFDHLLPSMNLRYELSPRLIGRLGLSRTIGRQNYNVYGSGFSGQSCGPAGCTVTGPNPNLAPLTANNTDVSLAWYFAKRSILAVNLFSSRMQGYPKTGSVRQDSTVDLVDPVDNRVKTYFINTASQQKARIHGIEISYEQPIGAGFGFSANASSASTKVQDGRPMVGASKYAANLGGYFENDVFSARLVYNYRSEYVSSSTAPSPTANSQGQSVINGVAMPTAPTMAAPVSNLAFSMNYNISDALQLSFNATNLLNPVRATYRYSEAEQQKVDASGRQYYLEARYKF